MSILAGIMAGAVIDRHFEEKNVKGQIKGAGKFEAYYKILNRWLALKQEGRNLESFFTDRGYQKIAIYGMGDLGNRLYGELEKTSIEIAYAIDKNAANIHYAESDIVHPDDELEAIDALIVTTVGAFREIEREMSGKVDCPIISLEDVVYGAW